MRESRLEPSARDVLIHRYVENGQVTRTFWEWRYKLLSLSFVVLPALGALATWSYQQELATVSFAGALTLLLL
jgi:hypothetical protein